MASSDPPAGGGGDASTVAPAPSGETLPPSSSKRRWSPCTWRYAIEDVQPELGSRPRSSSNSNPLYSASSARSASEHAAPPPSSKSRLHHPQDQVYGKESEEPLRRSAYSNRAWGGAEFSELRARQAQQPHAQDTLSRKKRPPHPQSNHQQQQKESAKRQSPKGDEEEEEEEEEEDDDGDDAELGHHFEEGKQRKKREMSPSELYYCDICRAKVEASKGGNINSNSPPPAPSEDP